MLQIERTDLVCEWGIRLALEMLPHLKVTLKYTSRFHIIQLHLSSGEIKLLWFSTAKTWYLFSTCCSLFDICCSVDEPYWSLGDFCCSLGDNWCSLGVICCSIECICCSLGDRREWTPSLPSSWRREGTIIIAKSWTNSNAKSRKPLHSNPE